MTHGIKANGVDPAEAFGCVVVSREIGSPTKRALFADIPYMDGFYDLSEMCGGPFYESREVKYGLAVYADDAVDFAQRLSEVQQWLQGINGDELRDGIYPGWHFVATTSKVTVKTIGAYGATVTATITCYPFLIADEETVAELPVGESTVLNGGRRVLVAGTSEGGSTVTVGAVSQSFSGTDVPLEIALESGGNAVTVAGSACTLKWREERI